MNIKQFEIDRIPAALYGEPTGRVWLYLHGRHGCKEETLPFAEVATARGWQVLSVDLPEHGARQGGKERLVPWTVRSELERVIAYMQRSWDTVAVRADSIGAYFAMLALDTPAKALFVSPVVDMERLICAMMGWAGVTETQLEQEGEIPTAFGETLSWPYLRYVRTHPVHHWTCPISVLYAGQDNMTDRETIETFSRAHDAELSVMENGEHWFHTQEQLAALRDWEREHI